jgi:hypothetical protein
MLPAPLNNLPLIVGGVFFLSVILIVLIAFVL